MFRLYILLLVAPFFFFSCEDDVDLNAEWTDITIVYGVLSRTDDTHYIKLNKAFLGEEDAFVMAKEADSIQYAEKQKVYLLEYELIDASLDPYHPSNWERTKTDTIWCERTNDIPKNETDAYGDPGIFGTQVNYLYKTQHALKEKMKYEFQAQIDGKEEIVSSETFMIYGITVSSPRSNTLYKVDLSNYRSPFKAEWSDAYYAKIYQVEMVFNYLDVKGTDTTAQTVHFNYPDLLSDKVRLPGDPTQKTFTQQVGGESFFSDLANRVDEEIEVDKRIPMWLDFYFYAGGSNLYTYIKVSESSSSFGQSQSEYSNISNGVGIFDSRYVKPTLTRRMSNSTLDSLMLGYYTKNLKFVNWYIE